MLERKLLLYFHKKRERRALSSEKTLATFVHQKSYQEDHFMCPSCKIAGHSHSNSKKLASFSPKQSLSWCISKTQIGGKFSQVRICVTEDANKWLNTSVMWANMLGSSRLPLSTWTTFEPPKTSKCSHCQKWSYQQRRNGAWTVTLLPHTCQKLYSNCHENSRKTKEK